MIVISATFVAEPMAPPLAFMLAELGILQDIRFAPYHQVFQELLTPGSTFHRNPTGINIALIRLEDFVRESASVEIAGQTVVRVADEIGAALKSFTSTCQGNLILCLLPPSPEVPRALANVIEKAGDQLLAKMVTKDNFQVLTQSEIDQVASADQHDPKRNALAHIPYSDVHFASLALALSRRIHALLAPAAKVLVLDCDNTLWLGVVGEDGVSGIALTPAYLALQDFAVAQQRKGVLLCLASKNSEADVQEVFARRSDMRLSMADVVAHRINWLSKADNLRALAKELNLGLDAFVFMDDNPLECAQMQAELPQVVTLQVPHEAEITQWLSRVWNFDKLVTTQEDAKRTLMYRENAARRSLETGSSNIGEFLAALDVQVDIQMPAEDEWQRIEQLTKRTNQFNFTTRRRSVPELKELLSQGAQALRVRVSDRFGDYGLVGVMIVQACEDALLVDTFLLSCRVLGRGVEHAMLRALGERALLLGLSSVEIELISSPRNEPARAFLDSVADAYRQTSIDGFCYHIPVEHVQIIRHQPGHDPDAVVQARLADERKGNATTTATGVPVLRSERYTRLASVLVSGQALLHEMASQRRRGRAISTPATPATPATPVIPVIPAATPTEERLKELWEEILSMEGLGVLDDYFALGGTSLQSVKLFTEIERRFGVQLRLTTILAAPTVRALAELIDSTSPTQCSSIVPLRTGGQDHLFLVHDGLGETLLYLHLARRLPSHVSVFGIEPRRLPNIPLAHASMADMAAYYVQQIRRVQPSGPYRLGGMCAGGVIAYAMAAHLRSLGECVEIVAILDGATPQAQQQSGRVAARRTARLRTLLQGHDTSKAAWTARLMLVSAVFNKIFNALRYESCAKLERISVHLRFRLLQTLLRRDQSWPHWLQELSVSQIYSELAARYTPPKLADVAILLVRASQGEDADTPYQFIYKEDDFGWRQVAGHLTLADVAGGHASMLQEAHVDSLASVLLAHLAAFANLPSKGAP
jgi:FkbH-like protein